MPFNSTVENALITTPRVLFGCWADSRLASLDFVAESGSLATYGGLFSANPVPESPGQLNSLRTFDPYSGDDDTFDCSMSFHWHEMESEPSSDGSQDPSNQENGYLSVMRNALSSPLQVLGRIWGDEICQGCQSLDLRKALSIGPDVLRLSRYGVVVSDVGLRFKEPPRNSCPTCHIFFSNRYPEDDLEPLLEDELRAFPLNEWYEGWDSNKILAPNAFVSLCVVPKGFGNGQSGGGMAQHFRTHGHVICYNFVWTPFSLLYPRIIKPVFDPQLVLPLLDYCRAHHRRCDRRGEQVLGLKFIDCEALTLVPALPDMQYVALSYVWGEIGGLRAEHGPSRIVPVNLSPVISAAVEVTKALNFRYLWVDQYCIDQHDHDLKRAQIKMMDLIYQDAEITIVAAAGVDQSYGLPGVRSRPRTVQRTARVGRYRIVPTMADPHHSIRTSKWFTRAWTLQEGLLSRRRLFFTDSQAYFECNAMCCPETVNCSLDNLHTQDKSEFQEFMRGSVLGKSLKYESPHQSFLQARDIIEEYSLRKLSFDEDSLNGISGILRYFGGPEFLVRHIWGVPLIMPEYLVEYHAEDLDTYLLEGLCWSHKYTCYERNEELRPRRRPGFPSWSWAGWEGALRHDRMAHPHHESPFGSFLSEIELQLEDGQRVTFEEIFLNPIVDERFCYPKAILCNVRILPPQAYELIRVTEQGGGTFLWEVFGLEAYLTLGAGPPSPIDLIKALHLKEYVGLMVGVDNKAGWNPIVLVFVMIVTLTDGVARRCGMLTVRVPRLEGAVAIFNTLPEHRLALE